SKPTPHSSTAAPATRPSSPCASASRRPCRQAPRSGSPSAGAAPTATKPSCTTAASPRPRSGGCWGAPPSEAPPGRPSSALVGPQGEADLDGDFVGDLETHEGRDGDAVGGQVHGEAAADAARGGLVGGGGAVLGLGGGRDLAGAAVDSEAADEARAGGLAGAQGGGAADLGDLEVDVGEAGGVEPV